jgi:hypothetical protein
MSRDTVLAQGRARVEASMRETILAASYSETVGDNLATVRNLVTTHYEGVATVEYPTLAVSEREVAGQQVSAADIVVKVPVAAPPIPDGDMIRVLTSASDGALVGREFRVKGAPQSGQVTSHRYPVEELT